MKFLSNFTHLRIQHLAWACLVLIVPFSCSNPLSYEKVEDPAEFAFSSYQNSCRMIIIGQVLDARTLDPIPGAAVQLFNEAAISSGNGMYRIEVEDVFDPIDVEQLLWADMPGYELTSFQFTPSTWIEESDCDGSTTYICVDLVMSPKKNMVTIFPNQDNKHQFMDTTLMVVHGQDGGEQFDTIITTMELLIPAGAVNSPTQICLSSYARSSYLGSLPESGLKQLPIIRFRISSDPMINLNLPFTVSFVNDHPVAFDQEDALNLLRMNSTNAPFFGYNVNTNRWRKPNDAVVAFNQAAQRIEVRSTQLGSYMVWNNSYELTYKDNFGPGEFSSTIINLNNCNCSEALNFNFDVGINGEFTYNLENGAGLTVPERLLFLNDYKILANAPFSALEDIQKLAGNPLYNHFFPEGVKIFKEKAMLPKCRQLYITSRDVKHNVSGFQYDRQFVIDRTVGVQLFYTTELCPITSACHQGCP